MIHIPRRRLIAQEITHLRLNVLVLSADTFSSQSYHQLSILDFEGFPFDFFPLLWHNRVIMYYTFSLLFCTCILVQQ